MFSRSNIIFFNKSIKLQKRSITSSSFFLPDSCPFVEHSISPDYTRERLQWPVKNAPNLIPQIVTELNEVTRQAFFGRALGPNFIKQQLMSTKLLDIYRDAQGQVRQYVRLDVYEEVEDKPVSIGVFRSPGFKTEIVDPTGHLMLRELSDRITISNPNPTLIHVNCAFNPRGYDIVKGFSDRVIPDIDLLSESMSREQLIRNINQQIVDAANKNPNIEAISTYYINKMEKTTGIKLQFVKDSSILIGCIPIPEALVSRFTQTGKKTSDIFNKLLNIRNGDMFLFYSEVSYDCLVNKLTNNEPRLYLTR